MSETYHKNPLGASGSAGRWNPKGLLLIYAARSPSLALLEYLCIKGTAVAGKPWYMVVFSIENDALIGELQAASLPDDWDILPHGNATQSLGKSWLAAQEFPFLKVPSARIPLTFYPVESNLLINPYFPGIEEYLQVKDVVAFNYILNR